MKKISQEVKKELLQLFVAECDDFKPYLERPFRMGQELWAADGYSMIALSSEHVFGKYEQLAIKLPKPTVERTEEKRVSRKDIERCIKQIPLIDEVLIEEVEEKCTECDGYGEVDFTYYDRKGNVYEHTADCPVCDGMGKATCEKESPTGRKTFNPKAVADVQGFIIQSYRLQQLLRAMELLNVESVPFWNDLTTSVFQLADGIEVIIMVVAGIDKGEKVYKV